MQRTLKLTITKIHKPEEGEAMTRVGGNKPPGQPGPVGAGGSGDSMGPKGTLKIAGSSRSFKLVPLQSKNFSHQIPFGVQQGSKFTKGAGGAKWKKQLEGQQGATAKKVRKMALGV